MLWLAVALHLMSSRPVLSATALSLGVLVKLGPLLALPFLFRRWNAKARIACLVFLTVGLGSFWILTRGESSGLRAYASRWRNNEIVFHYLEAWLGDFDAARLAASLIVAGVLAVALWRGWETVQASRLVIRVATLVSAVIHPWYLGWALMFEPFRPSAPWLLLSLTVTLNYGLFRVPAEGRSYHLPLEWRWVEYGLPLLLAAILIMHAHRRNSMRLRS
jgi:dipeptide/tripeptide permease